MSLLTDVAWFTTTHPEPSEATAQVMPEGVML